MNRGVPILLAIILSGAVLGFLFARAIRQKSSGNIGVTPIPTSILDTDITTRLNSREVNGQLPVQVLPEQIGRDNPFADF